MSPCRLPPTHRTPPHRSAPEVTATPDRHAGAGDPLGRSLMQAAFRDLHGARLHGYCLLLSLGDRPSATGAAASAIAEANPHLDELRHPERAAAWLRAAATQSLLGVGGSSEPEASRREALRALGVTDVAFDGLAGLQPRERAAFVASDIERLDLIDVEAVLGTGAAGARRLIERARRGYLAAASTRAERESLTSGGDARAGGLAARIEAVAERTVGARWSSR